MVDEQLGTVIREYLTHLRHQGLPVDFGVLYGSHARGQPHAWSDIDLIVVSPRFDQTRQWPDVDLLWHTAATTDSRIEPIGVGSRQWAEDQGIPLIAIARQEGEIIWPGDD